jgi:very-short-patch-repair endonuclease
VIWNELKLGFLLAPEFRFHVDRRWRFDYAIPDLKIAIEIEGGIWQYGRHNHPIGFSKDCEKYNTATLMGWIIFRLPDSEINFERIGEIAEFVKNKIKIEEH